MEVVSLVNVPKIVFKNTYGKISGPLLDRIDIEVEVNPVSYQNLSSSNICESSSQIRKRVNLARLIQLSRYHSYGFYTNSEIPPKLLEKFCYLTPKGKLLLQSAFEKLGFSNRAYGKILKIARTIADLSQSPLIQENHLLEALSYRSLDKKYWR